MIDDHADVGWDVLKVNVRRCSGRTSGEVAWRRGMRKIAPLGARVSSKSSFIFGK